MTTFDPAIYTGKDTSRRFLVRRYPDGSWTLTTTLLARESWAPEAELTAVAIDEVS